VYTWTTGINIATDVTLKGGPCDVFILQTTGILTLSSNANVLLSGGVQAANVFWQVAGSVDINTGAHIEGTILCFTKVVFFTGSSIYGRVYAQTAVTLGSATVKQTQTATQTPVTSAPTATTMAPTVYTPPPTEGAANIPDWWNDKDNKKDFDWGTVGDFDFIAFTHSDPDHNNSNFSVSFLCFLFFFLQF
jgi:hypothetical protein